MAKIVNDYVFVRKQNKYPTEWLNGETWTFAIGEDYKNAKSFSHTLRQKARNAGKRSNLSVQESGSRVYFRAYGSLLEPVSNGEATPAPTPKPTRKPRTPKPKSNK